MSETRVFEGYVIKGINGKRCPNEYGLSDGEEGNSYTVYLLLQPIQPSGASWDVSPGENADLRRHWANLFNKYVREAVRGNEGYPFLDVEYFEDENGGEIAVHGTTLKKIRNDQLEATRNVLRSSLESLMCYPNDEMRHELNRRSNFTKRAREIEFREDLQKIR